MLTLAYLGVYFYQKYICQGNHNISKGLEIKNEQETMSYFNLLRPHLKHGSVVMRNLQKLGASSAEAAADTFSPLLKPCSAGWLEQVLTTKDNKQLLVITPKMTISLKDWVSFLDRQNYYPKPGSTYVLFETSPPENAEIFLETSLSIPKEDRVKVVDCAVPLAWKSGMPFGIVAECHEDSLEKLTNAFMFGTLVMDDLLELNQMMSVDVDGNAVRLLRGKSVLDTDERTTPGLLSPAGKTSQLRASWDTLLDKLTTTQADSSITYTGSNESLASGAAEVFGMAKFVVSDTSGLSDVDKFTDASAEGLATDQEESVAMMDEVLGIELEQSEAGAGEALCGHIAELAPEMLTPLKQRKMATGKPPNILIYCGKKDSQRQFDSVKATIQQCIDSDKYVIYHLKHQHIFNTPWVDNTLLLIIASEKVYDGIDEIFLDYFKKGGMIMSFGSFFDGHFVNRVKTSGSVSSVLSLTYKMWNDVAVICTRWRYENVHSLLPDVSINCLARDSSAESYPIIIEVVHDLTGAVAILSQANLDKDAQMMAISPQIFVALKKSNFARCAILSDLFSRTGLVSSDQPKSVTLTPAILLSTSQEKSSRFLQAIQSRVNKGFLVSKALTLHLVESLGPPPPGEEINADCLPFVIGHDSAHLHHFNMLEYTRMLTSKILGHTVIYADVLPTTMSVIDSVMMVVQEEIGLVAIAGRQTCGKGRSGNAWLSPEGCAMFSLHVKTNLKLTLGQHIGLLQHMAAAAVVHAIRSLRGYQDLDLRLKWPNDIYHGRNMKLGGVIVQSSFMVDTIHCNIGLGFNVRNSNPTICINDLIEQHNVHYGTSLDTFSTEALIALTITTLEGLIHKVNTQGTQAFLDIYYKYWLHSCDIVHLESESGLEVQIAGLDNQGYLVVQDQSGTAFTLQPDGNSFDMMKNLIVIKTK